MSQLSTFDVDGDGRVDAGELAEVVEKLLREEAESGRIKYDAFSDRIRGKVIENPVGSKTTVPRP